MKEATERVQYLRNWYIDHAPMSVNRDLVCWKCHRSLYYYVEGWMAATDAETVRIRRAKAEAYMLEHLQPVIDKQELLVGQPDFTPFSAEEQEKYNMYQQMEWHGIPIKRGRADHLAPDFTLLLDKGVTGMLALVQEEMEKIDIADGAMTARWEYFHCCEIELKGLLTLSKRYADAAKDLAENAKTTEEKAEYTQLAETLSQVPAYPARTFREALQSVLLFKYSLFGIYSYGHMDRWLLPYYRRDIEAGILTPDTAQELIDCFFLMSVSNMSAWAAEGFMLGGRLADGTPVENELTWHFLTAIRHTHLPDPNVGFCVTEDTSPALMQYVSEILAEGHAQPQIWNSDAVTASMLKNGYDREAANDFTLSTCVEVTPVGKSGVSITSPYINLLAILLEAIREVPEDADFETIFTTFQEKFRIFAKRTMLTENLYQLERGRNCHDPIRVSLLVHDCIERGRSHDDGGAQYNFIEPNILGMANVIESLNVLQVIVFERKSATLDDLRQAMMANWEGYTVLHSEILSGMTHFGNDTPETNAIAKRVADMVLDAFAPITTVRGSRIIPGAFSYRDHIVHGKGTPASPDGRFAGDPLGSGSGPVQGMDISGPTASVLSAASWEPARFLGGTSVNVKLPANVAPETITALIQGYLTTKGAQLQFNVYNQAELLDAKLHPEKHKDLLVRIGGYSDFFVRLPADLQDEVISRSTNE